MLIDSKIPGAFAVRVGEINHDLTPDPDIRRLLVIAFPPKSQFEIR